MRVPRPLPLLLVLPAALALVPAPVLAKTYRAERYDVSIRVMAGGSLEVTEQVTFRFDDGPFTRVFREIPTRRTDGIVGVTAALDGRTLTAGDTPGQFSVRRGDNGRLRVVWHLAPTAYATHGFTLVYNVAGVVFRRDDEDVLEWRALPEDHDYAIDAASVDVTWPAGVRARGVDAVPLRHAAPVHATRADERAAWAISSMGRNASLEVRARFLRGALLGALPEWQQRDERARALAPRAIGVALVVFFGLAGLFLLLWVQSPRPAGREAGGASVESEPPGPLPVALAGALASGGGVHALHAMGALTDLAGRGAVRIEEREAGRWSKRRFVAVRQRDPASLATHERELLRLVFAPQGAPESEVGLGEVPRRLRRSWKTYQDTVKRELVAGRLVDPERVRARNRLLGFGVMVLVVAGISLFLPIVLIPKLGPWPIVVPIAAVAAGVVGVILAHRIPQLSDEGLRQAARWRRFSRQVRDLARGERPPHRADVFEAFLPYAAAFGLGATWAKRFAEKGVPAWFREIGGAEGGAQAAFVAVMSSSSFSRSGGSGRGAAGGAAGGGSSGAG